MSNDPATAVLDLDFIDSSNAADAAVKTVLGLLTTTLDESAARELTRELPDSLGYDRLRGHQRRPCHVSAKDCVEQIAMQFELAESRANDLIRCVVSAASRSLVSEAHCRIEQRLPGDWKALLDEGVGDEK